MKKLLLAGIIGFWSTSALAHSPLQETTPINEANLEEAPSEVLLKFRADIRLTRVSLSHEEQPSVDLDLAKYIGFVSSFALEIEPSGSGTYVIDWRGLGSDGHALKGSFSFMVNE